MSYEIVKSIALKEDENGFWYANVTSACNNVRPHYYSKWEYEKDRNLTKQELQKEILLDFYYGNFHGGTSTKYGKFLQFLGGSWGCKNEKSRACKTYHFYDKLINKLRNTKENNYKYRIAKLRNRQDRELKNALYKEFLQFKPTCNPTIARVWLNNMPTGNYIKQFKKQRKNAYFTDFNNATKFTNTLKLEYIKRLAEKNGYKIEFIKI